MIRHKLHTPLKYRTEFTVEGDGRFPHDMLRYDACFPRDEGAARDMTAADHDSKHWTVTLVHYSDTATWQPTHGRWASFGWHVVEMRESWA
jgi:hypothetical protein